MDKKYINLKINKTSNSKISTDEILEFICKKYKINLEIEIPKALYNKCIHKFVYLNGDAYCYKCNLNSTCKYCILRTQKEQYSENVDSDKFRCHSCNSKSEWNICKCKFPFYDCQCNNLSLIK
jgi:hypothetical protein